MALLYQEYAEKNDLAFGRHCKPSLGRKGLFFKPAVHGICCALLLLEIVIWRVKRLLKPLGHVSRDKRILFLLSERDNL